MSLKRKTIINEILPDTEEPEKKPNLTLMSSLVVTDKDGKRGISRGFWGDVVTGPFIAFGHQVLRLD